ncbi:thyroglobulin isoform X1 [Dipodomys spectabilis]|uniref:thyroglobulin isoform X1 n=1 Tax=Dipodomys spectabilis TaxID=105255 RepID=UPI001C539CA5|nr:thyroglobulin isoform X1 [Dipodomys spectabilis]
MALVLWVFSLLGSVCLVSANIFEYQVDAQPLRPCELQRERAFLQQADYIPQCSEDGSFQTVQCQNDGRSCWCVGADGKEVPGSRQQGRPVACLSFCQLHKQEILLSGYLNSTATTYLPQCQDSGDYTPVQCDLWQGQCWCVDTEGMEVYGTRQLGKPTQCPRSCEIRNRRLLHGVGDKSPPQCSTDGEFMPVQCKFVNITDMMIFDLLHNYNRFSDAFMTFSSFRSRFPEVSGYCYCADSQGRELAETGLELLLDEIYDTIFADLDLASTFTESTLYRILKRRFLAIQFVISGRFRCPTKCEVEQFAATRFHHPYIPRCRRNGDYQPVQCQMDGPCWCVDSQGTEIPGTQQQGQLPSCAEDQSCTSERRQALSRLYFGTSGYFSQHNLFSAPEKTWVSQGGARPDTFCSPRIKEFFVNSGLLHAMVAGQGPQLSTSGSLLKEAIKAILPSRELARLALQFTTNPRRLQQNLFGGTFLVNIGQFNLSGALGTRGTFNFSQFFQQLGLPGFQNGRGTVELAKLLSGGLDSNSATETSGASKEVVKNKTVIGTFGFEVNLQENQNALKFLASLLELPEFLLFLQQAIAVPESVARDLGEVMEMVLSSQACGETPGRLFVPSCTTDGSYEDVQCFAGECWCVDSQGKELSGSRVRGGRPRCPTKCEKLRARMQSLLSSQPAGSSLFIPSCTNEGYFLPVQCFNSDCYCVDAEGQAIPGTQSVIGEPKQCPTRCQLQAEQAFLGTMRTLLSNSSVTPTVSSIYVPQCSSTGQWRPVQCDGLPEQVFEWYERWETQNKDAQKLAPAELLLKIMNYKEETSRNFHLFVQRLYEAGQQGVFPGLAQYPSFQDVPLTVFEGTPTQPGGNILLEPYLFWQILNDQLGRYPGPLSDFSTPLAHFDLRSCWCVDETGEELEGTRAEPSKVPTCPGSCEEVRLSVLQFIKESEDIISASNTSFPLAESFLVAKGIRLTNEELGLPPFLLSREAFSEKFLRGGDYAIRLAAQSSLNFYGSLRSLLNNSVAAAIPLRPGPYVPQCDAFGSWEPVQCHAGTGHCWCVDGKGEFIPASLIARSPQMPWCPSICEQSRTNALLSGWKQVGIQGNPSLEDLFTPTCLETGEYARMQASGSGTWCVDPTSGEAMPPSTSRGAQCPGLCDILRSRALSRRIGPGFIPACEDKDGGFTPVQCDQSQSSCWCVLGSGEEVPGTRVVGSQPSCESPQCPLPFSMSSMAGGVVLCDTASGPAGATVQQCQLLCRQGYQNAFPQQRLVCNLESQQWASEPPHPQSCQRPQLWQTIQTQAHFQLQLPPGKMCSADYSGLLQAFQVFILDELAARGFCRIQVKTFGSLVSIPVCDNSSVQVGCLTAERLGVNVTWKARLEDLPAASLPDLYDIERALVGQDLLARFADLIRSGTFQLHLDSKTFQADATLRFIQGDSYSTSPRTRFGCLEGFYPVPAMRETNQDPLGCVKCPEGSYSQDEQCIPCPVGFYQEHVGSVACVPCPAGRTTVSTGAFSQLHCVTDCQKNEEGLQCDQDGQYQAIQRDRGSGMAFCVDGEGRRLLWSQTEAPLSDAQCLMMQKFEKAPEWKVVFSADAPAIVRSKVPVSESPLVQCLADCAEDDACSFLTVSTTRSEVSCDFYAWTSDNFVCTTSGQEQDSLGSSKAASFGSLMCQVKVKNGDADSLAVYLKKGQDSLTTDQKHFEPTGFQKTLSGLYSPMVFSRANLTDVHLFCLLACDHDLCCDGFVLMQVRAGPIVCGLLSSPDVLLCHVSDWRDASGAEASAACPRVTYNQESLQVTLRVGGQELMKDLTDLEEIQDAAASFQQIYLWKDSDMGSRPESVGCRRGTVPREESPTEAGLVADLFSSVDLTQIIISTNISLPRQQHWLFKHSFSAQQASLWCLSRCIQESTFCQLAEITESGPLYFTCSLYPEVQMCDDIMESSTKGCSLILPQQPNALFRKKVILKERVKSFYTRLPFQRLRDIAIRNKVPMFEKPISNGFFECERLCDADPCCVGFGFLNVSQSKGGEVTCLTLNSMGIQTCSEENGVTWRILDCGSQDIEVRTYPFGWYQKPVSSSDAPSFCPVVALPSLTKKVTLDSWQSLALSVAVVDPSIQDFDVAHISTTATSNFSAARDLCLWECSRHQACLITTLQTRPGAVRCVFYADTHSCTYSVQGQNCRLLLREEAAYIYRKPGVPAPRISAAPAPSVTIATHGQLLGRSQAIQVGPSWKQVDQFLGVPYAAPPLAESRFRAPEPLNWTGSWDATKPRASCWQPGARTPTPPGVSEDCLYLNVFVPESMAPNASVLVFFHNSMEVEGSDGPLIIDGSFLAAIGNLIVITANYRVGVFGFLSSGSSEATGNWGLLDQVAALTWVQTHIGAFGGDPLRVTLAADRGGADVASIHLLMTRAASPRLFRRALLMGGSALSPAAIISHQRAQQQAEALAKEVGCPSSSSKEVVACLRQKPANILSDAQTKLLAVSGPFHYWGPVVDGQYLLEAPARVLQRPARAKVDLLIGSSQDDGLINRAKAVKQFEARQGRENSKTAFYQALQNSLGGEDSDARVLAAATWYYSLEHSTDDYASFSRALENATRDYFITCPIIDMASLWARSTRGNVFLYHAPESYGHSSLELLADVQYAFGLPFYPAYEGQFSLEEKSLSLKVMQYFSNFIRSGNPNYPHEFSRKAPEFAAPWPDFIPQAGGESYKEFTALLPNGRGLKQADCSFWSKYIRALKVADGTKDTQSAGGEEEEDLVVGSELTEDPLDSLEPGPKSYSK